MLSKKERKRLQVDSKLETLPRISRPPEKLGRILDAIADRLPSGVVDQDLPSLSKTLEDLRHNRITREMHPELAAAGSKWKREYFRTLLLLSWAKQLRLIAKGYRKGYVEVFCVVDDGVDLSHDVFFAALDECGRDHDIRHLRECAVENCRKIFWAKRLPVSQLIDPLALVGCDERCKNILRVRRKRAKHKEEPLPQENLPSQKVVDAVRQTIQRKRMFLPGRSLFTNTPENIKLLAGLHEISPVECAAILVSLRET